MGLTGQEHLHASAIAKLADAKRALPEYAVEDVDGAMGIMKAEVSTVLCNVQTSTVASTLYTVQHCALYK